MFRPLLMAVIVGLIAPSGHAQFGVSDFKAACTSSHQNDIVKVDGFIFKTYESDDGSCLEVLSNGKVIFRRTIDSPHGFALGQPTDPQFATPLVANGTDVTGRGQPNMIVSAFTGGAHCCMYHLVFELAPAFRLLAILSDRDDDLAHFELDPRDGHYYYHTAEWTFAYWPSCFECSPSTLVILHFVEGQNGGAYHLALDKMVTPEPSRDEWEKRIGEVNQTVSDGDVANIGHDLWGFALELLYSGHSDLAWKFVKEAGPEAQEGHFPTLADFCSILKVSPYWPDLQPTLRDTPSDCAGAKPTPR